MILDTCAILWLASGNAQLSDHARATIASAPQVAISSISAMEIGQKYQKGKLSLPMPPSEWFHAIVKHHGLTVINLDADICLRATELPKIHKDPFDRLIISTALRLERQVVTADAVFSSYGVDTLC